jgi:cytochrome c2
VYEQPLFSWIPSIATSNVTLIKGFHHAWDGDLLVSSLAGKSLYRVRVTNNRVLFTEQIKFGKRIRYAHQHNDGHIVLWTDDKKLMLLSPLDNGLFNEFLEKYMSTQEISEAARKALVSKLDQCMECHSFDHGNNEKAPGFSEVYGSRIASTKYSYYSLGLKSKTGTWTNANLKMYLSDPAQFAPGTVMPSQNIKDPIVLDHIVNILKIFKEQPEQ